MDSKAKARARLTKWKLLNPEKWRAHQRAYDQRHRAKLNEASNARYFRVRRTFELQPRMMFRGIQQRLRNQSGRYPTYVGKKCTFTREEFFAWCLADRGYRTTFDAWVASGHVPALAPSVDRIDNDGDYSLTNIQIIPLRANGIKSDTM